MKSLGDIFRHAIPHRAERESANATRGTEEESPYLLVGQTSSAPQSGAAAPSRQ